MSDLSAPAIAIGQEVNKYSPDLASIRFSTSTYGKVVPLGWGTYRLSANVIFASSFLTRTAPVLGGADAHANCMYGVCEGPIVGFSRAWAGQNFYQTIASIPHHPSVPAAEAFLGSYSQNPPAWLSAQFPSQALSYRGLAYISAQQIVFGTGVLPSVSSIFNLPNLNFEVASSFQVGSISALAKTFTASSPTLNSTAHGFTEFQNIRLSTTGTLPSGLSPGVDYVCANVAANTYQLKVNPWDANVVTFSGAGTGTHTATPYFLDANPKDILVDFLTNVHYGAGFPSAQLAVLTDFFNYCKASGTFVSPVLETQEAAANFLERLATIGYSGMFFSENLLKLVPYCDTAITGNGITFTPNVTAVYPLTDDDFKPESGDDPVIVERRDPADAFNAIKIEFRNRFSQYSTEIVEIRDEAALGLYGYRPKDMLTLHEINDPAVAKWVAAFLLFREQAIACTYRFRLPAKYLLLEPMDLLTLTESTGTPLVNVPVRITEASEESDGYISIIAEDFPTGVALGVRYPNQTSNLGYAQNFNSAPGNANAPVYFIGPYVLSVGELQLWIGLSGNGNYGGCQVWGSYDDSSGPYAFLGNMFGRTVTGVLTSNLPVVADPDNTTTLGVDLAESEGTLASVTSGQAANGDFSLCYAGGELFSFTNVTPTGPNQFNLTNLRRGLYGTPVSSVASGSRFMFVSEPFFRFRVPPEFTVGRTLYLKLPAFNKFGAAQQALADVSPYAITLSAFTLPAPTGVALVSGTAELLLQNDGTVVPRIKVTWTAVAFSRVTGYELQFKRSSDSVYSDTLFITGQSANLAWIVGVSDGVNYDVRIRSVGAIREFSNWVTITAFLVIGKTALPTNVGTLSFTDPVLSWLPIADLDLAGYIVRYQPSASNDWASASPAHVDGFITETTFDTGAIVGGSTRLLVKSVDTSGNEATAASTIVVDLRPATPTSFFISRQPDGTREFSWATTTPPADLDGARIRYFLGSTSDWDAMTPLHTGLLKSSPWETNQLAAGTYTFAAKNVDKAGNESASAVFITSVTIADPRIPGAIEDIKEEPTWTGTKVDCHVDLGTGWLVANTNATWASPASWATWTFWNQTPKSPITYTRHIDIGVKTIFTPLVTTIVDGSQTIEERHSDDDISYTSFAAVGPQVNARYIDIRVTVTGSSPKVKAMRTVLSAQRIDELLEDVVTSALTGSYRIGTGDIRLPITKPFNVIKNVNVSFQSVGAGWSWELLDKDKTVGPHVKLYNASNALADATIDATVIGV